MNKPAVKIKAHVIHPDPFSPVLLNSESLVVSQEQKDLIKQILSISCSDSRFADKAYDAITYILIAGSVIPIGLSSLTPSAAVIGDPSFTLHVMGENFDQFSIINFAGQDEPTTFVNSTELTTEVDMSVWHGADVLPVVVKSPVLITDPVMFTFTDPAVVRSTSPVHAQSVPSTSTGLPPKPIAKTVEVKSEK